jgi:hypothetical protein
MKRSRSTLYRREWRDAQARVEEEEEPIVADDEHVSLLADEVYSQPVSEGIALKLILVVLLLIYFRLKAALSDTDFLELLTIQSLLWLPDENNLPQPLYTLKTFITPLLKKVNKHSCFDYK